MFWLSPVVLGVTRLASGSRLGRSPTAERPEGLEADANLVTRCGRRRLLSWGSRSVLSVVRVEGVARIRADGPVSGSARVGLLVIPSPRKRAA